ncbi:hypothetical protein [Haladaptatus halobius]|uniref:hypothetical protein n=1 Tax=Haladaptatus halobius TaxID=2884875 RepID=UPI001D0A0560|nr:hypothetical protein [Haladaptatus halobius]
MLDERVENGPTEYFLNFPVEAVDWEVSHRVQRQAGATKYDPETDETISTKPSAARDADETAQKRAQWGAVRLRRDAPRMVKVTNKSYENPADHSTLFPSPKW